MSDPGDVNSSSSGRRLSADAPVIRVVQICNKKGLHARASIMGLMMLAAGPGTSITIEASGSQAAEVVDALAALVSGRFTEEE